MDKYLNILIDALNKKDEILDQISANVDEQERLIGSDITSEGVNEYNRLMEIKGTLIESLNKLDDGFIAVYERISPELKKSPTDYTKQIKTIQNKITSIGEKTALIQAKEYRVHTLLSRLSTVKRGKQSTVIPKSHVAQKYSEIMNKTAAGTSSIFVDTKKNKK